MSRGSCFIQLDMPEAALAAMALQYELRALRQRVERGNAPDGLKESLDRSEQLFERLAKRLATAGVKVKL